jgi:site-specific DNA-cytosine methylase
LIFGSVCSGIEAASVAWLPIGLEAAFFSEIEAFPSAVLAHHYQNVPNLGDMTKFKEWPDYAIDVLVGGTPCQSFSVAGLRKGLDDPRGNLTLTFLAVAARYRPRWLVWENVPGVLSDKSGAFGALLGGLGQLGYGFAYRILDAQYFRLAQRRRRVFVVGHIGGLWQRAAAVLFERESLSGNPPPSREAGKGTSGTLANSLRARGNDSHRADSGNYIAATLDAATPINWGLDDQHINQGAPNFVIAHALKGEGHDASEDGTGRGVPLVTDEKGLIPVSIQSVNMVRDKKQNGIGISEGGPMFTLTKWDQHAIALPLSARVDRGSLSNTLQPNGVKQTYGRTSETDSVKTLRILREEIGAEAFAQWGLGVLDSLQPSEVLRSAVHGKGVRLPAFSRCWMVYCSLSRPENRSEGAVLSVREAQCAGCSPHRWEPPQQQLAHELGTYLSELSQPGAQTQKLVQDLWQASEGLGLLREALSAFQEVGRSAGLQREPAHAASSVRRLTATECEFLQGFPRHYTAIPWRGKPADQCSDGPRYKALGNSMAVPVMHWIGRRIQAVEQAITAIERPAA